MKKKIGTSIKKIEILSCSILGVLITEPNRKNWTGKLKIKKIGFFFFVGNNRSVQFLVPKLKTEPNQTKFILLHSNYALTNMLQVQKYPCAMRSLPPQTQTFRTHISLTLHLKMPHLSPPLNPHFYISHSTS